MSSSQSKSKLRKSRKTIDLDLDSYMVDDYEQIAKLDIYDPAFIKNDARVKSQVSEIICGPDEKRAKHKEIANLLNIYEIDQKFINSCKENIKNYQAEINKVNEQHQMEIEAIAEKYRAKIIQIKQKRLHEYENISKKSAS